MFNAYIARMQGKTTLDELRNHYERHKSRYISEHPGEYVVLSAGPWCYNPDTEELDLLVHERFSPDRKSAKGDTPSEPLAGRASVRKRIPQRERRTLGEIVQSLIS